MRKIVIVFRDGYVLVIANGLLAIIICLHHRKYEGEVANLSQHEDYRFWKRIRMAIANGLLTSFTCLHGRKYEGEVANLS